MKLLSIKSYFYSMIQSFPADLVHRTMIKVCSFIWVLICNLLSSSVRHLIEHLAGSRIDDDHKKNLGTNLVFSEPEERIVRSSSGSIFDGFSEEEESGFRFGFQFQMKEDDLISGEGIAETEKTGDVLMENGSTTTTRTSKYQFVSVQDFGVVVAEPKSGSFTVHELFVEPRSMKDDFIIKEKGISQSLVQEEVQNQVGIQDENKELNNYSSFQSNEKDDDVFSGPISQRIDLSDKDSISSEEKSEESVTDASSGCDEKNELNMGENGVKSEESVSDTSGCDEVQELREKNELNLGENVVTEESNIEVQDLDEKNELNLGENGGLKPKQVNWLGDFFMRNDSFCYGFDSSQEVEFGSLDHHQESDDSSDGYFSISPQDVDEKKSETLIPDVLEEIDDGYIELEPDLDKEQPSSDSNGKYESDSCFENSLENELMTGTVVEEEGDSKSWEFDSDEEEEEDYDEEEDADVLLEHQELIGQMKMELKNARTGGLPTILEESETPRMKEEYKPLKINEKLEHRDQMAEIQKFYKSYSEKMRKLDVLNYQTLQAINFLRMKHPDQLNTGENASLSAIKSVLLPSLWPCKLRKIYADPTLKSITELHKDLEIVYVGQACLSWEILHWQYKKAKELQLYDPQGYRSYNQVAIEFQQFHVLLRRFTEDELFQGPRVQNYTKQRCTLRGLLQVPAIKDDNLKEKKARKEEEEEAVSISTMAKMIKESMTVFWEFLHTDKDTTNLFLTIILQGSKAHLQDPQDSELFMEIKTIHQKKDKRLKDLLRTGNCIVKKFQKQQETILDQHMFVSQVELRLVSRVLSLPRLSRDQLIWCQSKLNNIKFIDRKIQVEDSLFLLFPC